MTVVQPGVSRQAITDSGLMSVAKKEVLTVDDPFDSPTYHILEKHVFDKALKRIQDDGQVRATDKKPEAELLISAYLTDEDGVEHVEVNFFIRGPHGAGKVYTEMFNDKADKEWKYTYLSVEILAPSPAKLMLESYLLLDTTLLYLFL
ncbi:unnamed protein product [Eruca vesicaria subsp. sativa]|uniref:Mitochondrial import inner membrane translocase subunit Tim21 n=1 Tax=Eruca vesicaria subsp. sativa TaxID=29727 RepID=A0ABC8KZT0_ERUVS|nr:unnamed protein product [Eruca vesicaria subsp. sativa]